MSAPAVRAETRRVETHAAMLAYLFWHQPAVGQARSHYEHGLRAFHEQLRTVPVPGLIASRSARVQELPWMRGDGYEDCYLVTDFAALGVLNAAAVDGAHIDAHDRVAHAAAFGAGGLYALDTGEPLLAVNHCAWLTKPVDVSYPQFLSDLTAASGHSVAVWRRQMVLGPAPEFRVTAPTPITVLAGLHPITNRLTALDTAD